MEILIPSAYGVEAVVKRQLNRLGYADTRAIDGRVHLQGEWTDVARLNMFIASGERVLIELATFDATTFDMVYDNIYAYDWQTIMPRDAKIMVYAKSVNSQLFAIKSLCSIMKKAIVDKLKSVYHCNLEENGARYVIELAIRDDHCSLTLDTSGEGLHKRGYRQLAYTAPLKETLASALIDLSVYNPDKQLADLFCGSGTIPIEACLRALNIAPGINRAFDYCAWKNIPQTYYSRAKEEAEDVKKTDKTVRICGFDIDKNAISISRYHAKLAGIEDKIHFQVADMRTFSTKQRYGVAISNPPYGERLSTDKEVELLYRDLGKLYAKLPDWSMYILTSYTGFERAFGRRADKKRQLFNANIDCLYYSFMGNKPPKIKNE